MSLPNRATEIKSGLRAIGNDSPAVGGTLVTAGIADQGPYASLWIANAGNVEVRTINGDDHLIFKNVPVGWFSVMVDRVYACPADTIGVF